MSFDSAKAGLLVGHVPLDLGLAEPQHAPELFNRRVVVEQLVDLLQGKAEIS
jgi:hypothetical protein